MVPYQANDYIGFAKFVDDVLGRAKDDDWVMMDKADAPWTWSREHYIKHDKGVDMAKARREAVAKGESIAWGGFSQVIKREEWGIINDYYFAAMNPLVLSSSDRPKLHLMFVTEVKDMEGEKGDDLRGDYNAGVMPTGQKQLPFQMRTLVQLEKVKATVGTTVSYRMTTAERHGSGRTNLDRVEWSNFAMSYLMGVARWTAKPPTSSLATPMTSREKSPQTADDGSTPSPGPAGGSRKVVDRPQA